MAFQFCPGFEVVIRLHLKTSKTLIQIILNITSTFLFTVINYPEPPSDTFRKVAALTALIVKNCIFGKTIKNGRAYC